MVSQNIEYSSRCKRYIPFFGGGGGGEEGSCGFLAGERGKDCVRKLVLKKKVKIFSHAKILSHFTAYVGRYPLLPDCRV